MHPSLVSAALVATLALTGCAATTHTTQPSSLGTPRRSADMFAAIDQPGPIQTESVVSTEWAVPRSGLINLDRPKAKAAGLVDGDEPIEVFFHVVRHPKFGTFIIDTGVERALRDAPEKAAVRGFVASYLHHEKMGFEKPLGDWLAAQHEPVRGVFFTHLHLDHTSGAPDLPKTTPLYVGPGETTARHFLHMFTQSSIDRSLEGLPPLNEWRFAPDPDGRFAGVLDVFGDGSFWAIWTPGHSHGSTAYLARTTGGPVLFTGDTCHTRWGWENDVDPGSFTEDHDKNVESLSQLRRLVREHPAIEVRLGHQYLEKREDPSKVEPSPSKTAKTP
jgi:glyoxylase-like metal-dependent hydrolase (beta-lactamase superfamily II)